MKNYNKPELNIIILTASDVITVSGFGDLVDWVDSLNQEL